MQTVVAALIREGGRILIGQRSAMGPHPRKWEFPGGKVEIEETPDAALVRELREELGIEAVPGNEFARYEYAYPGKASILLIFLEIKSWSGVIANLGAFETIVWETPGNFPNYDFLEGDLPLIQLLREIHVDQV